MRRAHFRIAENITADAIQTLRTGGRSGIESQEYLMLGNGPDDPGPDRNEQNTSSKFPDAYQNLGFFITSRSIPPPRRGMNSARSELASGGIIKRLYHTSFEYLAASREVVYSNANV